MFARSDATAPSAPAQAPASLAASVTDAMRAAPVFTAYDFTIHLDPAAAGIAVELRTTIRNGGTAQLPVLPLQLSSSLHFERLRSGGASLRFAAHLLASDADHTGALTEAAVELPAPLAPGESREFTVEYSGTLAPSSARLDRIGTPAALAAGSDWDRVGEDFTGLRGFGNSVWYPVASIPALLGDGDRLFREIGRQGARNSGATVSMAVTSEFSGSAPNVAVLDGVAIAAPAPASLPTASFPGVVRVSLPPTALGFGVPSLVLATRSLAAVTPLISVDALPADVGAAPAYSAAADLLTPLFTGWLGPRPASPPEIPLQVIDLPVADAPPTANGDAYLTSLTGNDPAQLAGELSALLAHVYFHSPRAWLREGVAGLMAVLWTERTAGRAKAIEQLGGERGALALAEPESPGVSPGEPLLSAQDPVFYRAKATYVLWMLRTLAGDTALGAALRAYDPGRDTTPGYFETILESAMARQPAGRSEEAGEAGHSPDLGWFFSDWVYNDPGLPDLAITNAFPSPAPSAPGQWLLSVEISNSGYAEAEVPVTVRSATTATTVQLRVPARGSVTRRILVLGEPTEVDVNDGGVPEVEAGAHQRMILKQSSAGLIRQ